jgi:Tol biopolymer transport system component
MPSVEIIRRELDKVLASVAFANSPRMSRFLRFVVEKTLAGEGDRIKEYVIAVDVFEKGDDYDPKADSTVRTEATKLRSRLNRYYATDGREDPIVITIPKGSYVAQFEERNNGTLPVTSRPATRRAPFSWLRASAILVAAAAAVGGGFIWRSHTSPLPAPRLVPITSYPELEEQPGISPDGTRVAFRWKGEIYVKQIGTDGGEIPITKNPGVESFPAWSPDGSRIAFVRNGEVFLVPSLGGPERKVAESAGRVAWTPDGSALLVLKRVPPYAQSVFRVSLEGGREQRLTSPEEPSFGDIQMAMSPDGRTLAFCRSALREGCDLFLVPASGGKPRKLTNDGNGILGLAWTADGREIVFASDRHGRSQVWRVAAWAPEPGGPYPEPVLIEAAGDDARNPSISKNARLIYQQYRRNFDIQRAEIVGDEGAPSHQLKPGTPLIASTRRDATPSWSPDETKIAFISDRSGSPELWICDADGSNPLQLTSFNGPHVILPRWSRDGRIAFSALTGPGGNFESYVIGANYGRPQRIAAPGHRSMAHPVFSHDGRWIYFVPGAHDGAVEAFRMAAEGGEAVQITHHMALRPEESPDGKLLYYGKRDVGGLWSMPVAGGEERRVLDSIAPMNFNWTVAAHGIYYFDFAVKAGAPKQVKFYSFKTGKINQVGTVEPTVSQDYSGISVSPDGRWLLYSYIASITSDVMMVDHFR